jgi:hypothetical protein
MLLIVALCPCSTQRTWHHVQSATLPPQNLAPHCRHAIHSPRTTMQTAQARSSAVAPQGKTMHPPKATTHTSPRHWFSGTPRPPASTPPASCATTHHHNQRLLRPVTLTIHTALQAPGPAEATRKALQEDLHQGRSHSATCRPAGAEVHVRHEGGGARCCLCVGWVGGT